MAQQNEPNHSLDPATVPSKRKRGRPRKEDVPGTEPGGRSQRRRQNPPPTVGQGLVGQPVSGVLDGVFDAGFLITVRVGSNGPPLRGMVFDSRLAVPISATNDVAPHIKMSKRKEIPIPVPISAEPLQRRGPTVPLPSSIANKGVLNDGSQGSAFRSKDSEAVIPGMPSIVSKTAAPVTIQVPDNQRQGLTGEQKLDSTHKESQGNETASVPKLGSTSQAHKGDEAAGERIPLGNQTAGQQKLCSTRKTPLANETTGALKLGSTSQTPPSTESTGELHLASASQTPSGTELKLGSTSQTPLGTETAGELKLDSTSQTSPGTGTAGELKPDSTSQTPPSTETTGELKLDPTSQATLVTETAGELKLDSTSQTLVGTETARELKLDPASQTLLVNESIWELEPDLTSQISLQPHVSSFVSDPYCMEMKIQNDSDQIKASASAVATVALTVHTSSEISQETKTDPVGGF